MKKIVLVTGASGGIGSAIAVKLIEAGYAVVLHYNSNRDAINRLIASFPSDATYLTVSCDLTDSEAVSRMISVIHDRLGRISLLVNCAGIAPKQKMFSDTSDSEYDTVFEANVHAPMRLTRLLSDDLRFQQGSVVTISSMWGITGGSCEVLYSASKAALIGFTKALAKELAPSGVTVNSVAPGLIRTAMNAHLTQAELDAFQSETPLNRLGTPEDVAEAVLYLASARFVTGQVLSCDGGYTI